MLTPGSSAHAVLVSLATVWLLAACADLSEAGPGSGPLSTQPPTSTAPQPSETPVSPSEPPSATAEPPAGPPPEPPAEPTTAPTTEPTTGPTTPPTPAPTPEPTAENQICDLARTAEAKPTVDDIASELFTIRALNLDRSETDALFPAVRDLISAYDAYKTGTAAGDGGQAVKDLVAKLVQDCVQLGLLSQDPNAPP
jgi:hypothetical protein